jgi:sugar lactone lactonase YvrE
MRLLLRSILLAPATLAAALCTAQCPAGQLEVTIEVVTDDWGNETYWQLVPYGNTCGQSPLFIGGNTAALTCTSGGTQTSPSGGYASNTTINAGPWCLDEGSQWSIVAIDSYGDAQATYRVFADGASIGEFNEDGGFHIFSFTVMAPEAHDLGVIALTTPLYNTEGLPTAITGTLRNFGSETITAFTLNAALDGALVLSQGFTGVSIPSGNIYEFTTSDLWTPDAPGSATLTVWATDLNGQPDAVPSNDIASAGLVVNEPTPDLVNDYLAAVPTIAIVADDDEDLLTPRDLAFHPDRSRDELWVINKDVANTGGSTVRFFSPGQPQQTHLWQRDPNAWHFMSLPTAIAFGDNGNFATCPGIFDANQNGGDPFTGPSLWSGDPAIYAQPGEGPLGSHLDMLHVNPRSQGIAHERWNRYWVVDGHYGDVVMNDFREDHGPGNTWHGDAVIRRYAGINIQRDPNDHIVSHCEFDKRTGWLYVVDHGNQRVVRLDTRSGSVSGPGAHGPWESYVEYSQMSGHTWETVASSGLQQPAGITLSGNHLLVSDHANGDIVVYDLAAGGFPEVGRIATGLPGIMGIEVGPDGRIWFVNATTHALGRLDPAVSTGVHEPFTASAFSAYPNPASDRLFIAAAASTPADAIVTLLDASGRKVMEGTYAAMRNGIDVSSLGAGAYALAIGETAIRLCIQH